MGLLEWIGFGRRYSEISGDRKFVCYADVAYSDEYGGGSDHLHIGTVVVCISSDNVSIIDEGSGAILMQIRPVNRNRWYKATKQCVAMGPCLADYADARYHPYAWALCNLTLYAVIDVPDNGHASNGWVYYG